MSLPCTSHTSCLADWPHTPGPPLLQAPFCVHPKTGKVCVPLDPADPWAFDPVTSPPTLAALLEELGRVAGQGSGASPAAAAAAAAGGGSWTPPDVAKVGGAKKGRGGGCRVTAAVLARSKDIHLRMRRYV